MAPYSIRLDGDRDFDTRPEIRGETPMASIPNAPKPKPTLTDADRAISRAQDVFYEVLRHLDDSRDGRFDQLPESRSAAEKRLADAIHEVVR